MTKRHYPKPADRGDIFGQWIGITALLASKTDPLAQAERDRIRLRLHSGLEDIMRSPAPMVASWRDLTDAMNMLQSAVELGWAHDSDGAIEAAKAALYEGYRNATEKGALRMSGASLGSMRNLLEQFSAVLDAISAHSYWKLVSHTQRRVKRILRGAKRPGDVVVTP